jgi:uncharacterized protein YkwD
VVRPLLSLIASASLLGCAFEVGEPVAGHSAALRDPAPVEVAFVRLLNDYRVDNGVPEVMIDLALQEGAYDYSLRMGQEGFFDHVSPEGGTFSQRMCDAGYNPACGPSTLVGENIAAGQQSAREVFDAWRMSPGHNANMLDARYRVVGVGRANVASSSLRYYWTNTFGGEATAHSHPVDELDPADPPPDPMDPPPDPMDPPDPTPTGSPATRASRGSCSASGPGGDLGPLAPLALAALFVCSRRRR